MKTDGNGTLYDPPARPFPGVWKKQGERQNWAFVPYFLWYQQTELSVLGTRRLGRVLGRAAGEFLIASTSFINSKSVLGWTSVWLSDVIGDIFCRMDQYSSA